MFFGFFQLQGILAAILCAPFAVVSMNKSPALSPIEIAGIALWVVAILGEILSDHQLQAFRYKPENKGRVCDVGLWSFSRHPNYFFEWLIWVSYYLFACGASNGWQTIFVPLLMLFFLTKVTGIPPPRSSRSSPAAMPTAIIRNGRARSSPGSRNPHKLMLSVDDLLARDLLPDAAIRLGIRRLLAQKLREEGRGTIESRQDAFLAFIDGLDRSPIAVKTGEANEQHYEVPTEFFKLVLGPRMKYSSGYWPDDATTFAESEEAMLALTCERAELADGMDILELGCGWGSLTLWMAEKYPNANITGVSNSRTQKEYIDAEAARRGLRNVTILTADMNDFEAGEGRLRPRGFGRDVRAHEELPPPAREGSKLAEGRREALRAHLHAPRIRLPLRWPRSFGLDHAILLRRRYDAIGSPASLFSRRPQNPPPLAGERDALSTHIRGLVGRDGSQRCRRTPTPRRDLWRGKRNEVARVLAGLFHVVRGTPGVIGMATSGW